LIDQGEIAFRLIISFILGGLIGLERESHNKSAGLRTHILVSLGATLMMLISIYGFPGTSNRDPARIAAQVVSGIGFLGAGTIMREGSSVKGLTTAASIWVVAGIGLAVGAGFFVGAAMTTGIVFITLISLAYIERHYIQHPQQQYLNLQVDEAPGQIGKIGTILEKHGVIIKKLEREPHKKENRQLQLRMLIKLPLGVKLEQILVELVEAEGVYSIQTDD